jgi:hypothetical protein
MRRKTMMNKDPMNSPQKTARLSACVFIGIFVRNIAASETLFRFSLVSDLIRQVLLMVLPLVLYRLLKPVDKSIASLMVIFALVCVPISLLNELNHFAVLLLSSNAGYKTAFNANQLNDLVTVFLELRNYGTYIPQLISVWVLLLGYLVFKSGFLPRILGILLMLAGLCYTAGAVLFEALFYLWLLIKGVNVKRWEERAFKLPGRGLSQVIPNLEENL